MAISIPTALIMTLLWFPFDFGMLFFTYVCPLVPFVLVFDGFVSALRIRTFSEVMALAGEVIPSGSTRHTMSGRNERREFEYGYRVHTWPLGYINWIVWTKSTTYGACRTNEIPEQGMISVCTFHMSCEHVSCNRICNRGYTT